MDVKLEPTPSPVKSGQETNYKVTFLQKGTSTVQVHIDYDFVILKDNTTEVFKASQKTGQPLLHTAEGLVTIPFTIEEPGSILSEYLRWVLTLFLWQQNMLTFLSK